MCTFCYVHLILGFVSSSQELVCRNVKGCPSISFKVPDDLIYEEEKPREHGAKGAADIMMEITRGYVDQRKPSADNKSADDLHKHSSGKDTDTDIGEPRTDFPKIPSKTEL